MLLCKCCGESCNSSVYAWLRGCGPHLHVVSRCCENGDEQNRTESTGHNSCFVITQSYFAFLSKTKKKIKNQESPPRAETLQKGGQKLCGAVIYGG